MPVGIFRANEMGIYFQTEIEPDPWASRYTPWEKFQGDIHQARTTTALSGSRAVNGFAGKRIIPSMR